MKRAKQNLLTTAMGGIAVLGSSSAFAQETHSLSQIEVTPTKVERIDSSRLGCGQGASLWHSGGLGTNCAFDTATRGVKVSTQHETGFGTLDTYATVARSSVGAFTANQILNSNGPRQSVDTNLILLGFKASTLNQRIRLSGDFGWSERLTTPLAGVDRRSFDPTAQGTYASVRLDAKLIDQPGLSWSLTGEYKSVSEGYSVGPSTEFFRYSAMPGTRMALSTSARIGPMRLKGGVEKYAGTYGVARSLKAGLDLYGIVLQLSKRETIADAGESSTLIVGHTLNRGARLDIDTELLATSLFPTMDELPSLLPTNIGASIRSSSNESRYVASTSRYERFSLGLDAMWETPLGETGFRYWQDTRTNLIDASARNSETIMVDHSVRLGDWRFGVDAMLNQSKADGSLGGSSRNLSFGQSVSYKAKDGPELRISMGQDLGTMRLSDSYASADNYSSITASLDLSRYLQKRFERDDLRLTLDYRKVVDRSESEISFEEELIERWVEGERREGFIMSFGMKL